MQGLNDDGWPSDEVANVLEVSHETVSWILWSDPTERDGLVWQRSYVKDKDGLIISHDTTGDIIRREPRHDP